MPDPGRIDVQESERHIATNHEVETFTGRYVDTSSPDPSTITLEDIAHALAHTCRFGGHCAQFYSVAEHAVHVSNKLVKHGYGNLALAGLHHDDHEAYLGDIPRPLKPLLGLGYKKLTAAMTRDEVVAFLAAATTVRERRVSHLGVCAGIRSFELRHLQRRHFERDGFVHVSHDIGKGGRERWIPVLPELQPIVDEILETVEPSVFDRRKDAWIGEYVIPGERWRDPGRNTVRMDVKLRPASRQVLRTVVMELGERAGIHAHLHPHLMRHAFGDHVARYAGMRNAQAMLGHADVGTTQMYTGAPTLDELAAAVSGYRFSDLRTGVLGIAGEARDPREAPTRIELVEEPTRLVEPFLRDMLDHLAPTALLYAEHFGGVR